MSNWLYSQRVQVGLLVLLVAACAGFWFWGIESERSLLANQAGSVDRAEAALHRTQNESNRITALLDAYHHNVEEIAFFREQFLQQKPERIAAISEAIAELAEQNRISLEEVRYNLNLSTNRDVEVYQIDLPLLGRFSDLRRFIAGIESSPHFLTITRVEVESAQDYDGAVRASLSLATYFSGERP